MTGSPPLRWGILGTASIARRRFIPGVRRAGMGEVTAIASRDEAAARAAADELEIPRAYGSYEALLADPAVDVVYNPLPNSLHEPWTIRAAEAGKHVLCEKPLARTAAAAERMAAACGAAGVLLVEGFMYRHHPRHERAKALLAGGAIGTPTMLRASYCYSMAPERRPTDVRLRADLEGGSLMDIGCYALNVARYVLGAEPVEVTALQHVDPRYGVETSFAAVVRFPGDLLATIDSSFESDGPHRYEISGTGGRVVVEEAFRAEEKPSAVVLERGEARTEEPFPPFDVFAAQAQHMARCVEAGRVLAPAEDGVAQARAIEALYRSAADGTTVRLG